MGRSALTHVESSYELARATVDIDAGRVWVRRTVGIDFGLISMQGCETQSACVLGFYALRKELTERAAVWCATYEVVLKLKIVVENVRVELQFPVEPVANQIPRSRRFGHIGCPLLSCSRQARVFVQ